MPGTVARRPAYPPAVIVRGRESEALLIRPFRRRNRHVAVPLAVPPVMWTAGEIMHAYGAGPEAAAAGAVLAVAVWFFAPHKWTDRDGRPRAPEVWYARLSALGTAGWLSAAAFAGPGSGLPGEILGGMLAAGTGAWGVIYWRHKRPRGMSRRRKLTAQWDAWWQHHCRAWGLEGSKVTEARESGVQIILRVQLWAGRQSVQHVTQAVHLIESALQGIADIGMIRVQPVKGNASQVDIFLKRENPLAQVVEWDPALAPRSVHDDAVHGLTETGIWKTVPMRVNKFTVGKTRSGKSNDLLVLAAQLSGCPDDRQVLIDLKGGRSARPLLEAAAVDYVITDVDEARTYLLMLTAEIRARAMNCYTGEEQLLATEEVPAIHTLIDEVHGLASVMAGDTECAGHLAVIAAQGSGLEVYLAIYTQYGALEESVRSEQVRMNLALRVVYAVEVPDHGSYAIPEYHKHDASKLEERGTHLLKLGKNAHPEQIRAPHMPHPLLKSVAAANARRLAGRRPWLLYCGAEPCPAGGTWQQWWDSRWLRLDPAFRESSPQYAQAAAGEPESAYAGEYGPAVTIAPAPSAPGEGDAREVAARIEAETAGPDAVPTRRAAARVGDITRQQKEAFCDALEAGRDGISPDQLTAESGMSRSWVHSKLPLLIEAGAVTQLRRGIYAPVPGADIHGALRRLDAEADALLADAGRTVRRLQTAGDRR